MQKMPALFVGHGSPMNAIEQNEYTLRWKQIGQALPKPKAILSISAHWFTNGTRVSDLPALRMVYDMYGFPRELYEIVYPAKGAPALAQQTAGMLPHEVIVDNSWGLDHGAWVVLRRLYPEADVPVLPLSIDMAAPPQVHYAIGKALASLRDMGVLILGSGNVVHNLARINPGMAGGYPWAEDFDHYIRSSIESGDHASVIDYSRAGESASLAFTTLDHFAPLLYVLGASGSADALTVFNDSCMLGAMSMTGYLFEPAN